MSSVAPSASSPSRKSGATSAPGHGSGTSESVAVPQRLDELLALDTDTLAKLYAQAKVPRLPDLSGDLRGRMLAWSAVTGVPATILRTLASSKSFPWRGKTFAHSSEQVGGGDNRVVSDRLHLFKFGTFVGPSRAGDFEAVQLDYDKPSNPFFIRAIKDEVRELRSGLWLGQAYLVAGKSAPRLVLYFALEQRLVS
jgi:hypothetical protein